MHVGTGSFCSSKSLCCGDGGVELVVTKGVLMVGSMARAQKCGVEKPQTGIEALG